MIIPRYSIFVFSNSHFFALRNRSFSLSFSNTSFVICLSSSLVFAKTRMSQDIGLIIVWHCIVIMDLVKGMVFLKIYCMSGLRNYTILYLKPMMSVFSDLRFLSITLFSCYLFFQITLGCMAIPSAYRNGFSFGQCLTVFLTSAEGCLCQYQIRST